MSAYLFIEDMMSTRDIFMRLSHRRAACAIS